RFTPGVVTVSFCADTWADTAGNRGVAGTQSFRLIDSLKAGGSDPQNRVFFIDISGGLELNLADLTKDEPVLEIRGKVSLEIGSKDGHPRFTLTASGTIKVIKIGNIASGAASFVLETGDSLGDTKFWGVAA